MTFALKSLKYIHTFWLKNLWNEESAPLKSEFNISVYLAKFNESIGLYVGRYGP